MIRWGGDDVPRPVPYVPKRTSGEKIGEELQVDLSNRMNWGKVTRHVVLGRGGAGLIQHYNGSLSKALEFLYPFKNDKEHDWWKGKSNGGDQ